MKKQILIVGCCLILLLGIWYFQKNNESIHLDINYKTDVDTSNLTEKELSTDYKITKEGIYELTDTISQTVYVNTEGNVKLILKNVSITSENGPAIYIEKADNVVIYLEDDTVNSITDDSEYNLSDTDVTGAIYSKADLFFEGTGVLHVISNYEDAIVSKDDLVFKSGTYKINAQDDGIRGKDSVVIYDGVYEITSKGDAIKSTNTTDTEKGYIIIETGEFIINATLDGIQAETSLLIKNGTFTMTTGGGSSNVRTSNNWGRWGNTTSTTESAKAIKAENTIQIENGTFTIDSSDDAIHSNNNLLINNGSYSISSGDDGIHADNILKIVDGTVTIQKSYEGIEAGEIIISGGNLNVTSSDDGINSSGGNDSSSMNRPGANQFSSDGSSITIEDGMIYVNASGDGIDSNGDIVMKGGIVVVNGPTDSGNGAIDKNGTFTITGGTLLASGSSGMVEMPSSGQNSVMIYFENTISAGEVISIFKGQEELITYKASKNYTNLVVSSPLLTSNQTYTIYTNGNTSKENQYGLYEVGDYKEGSLYKTFQITLTTTTVGSSYGMPGGMPGRR